MQLRLTLIILLFFGAISATKAQSADFHVYTFECATIDNSDEVNFVQNYFLNNYSDHVSAYTSNLDTRVATLTSNVDAIDIMQIFRHLGYEVLFVEDGIRYFLSEPGTFIVANKQ
jgi:hypothetical protein